MGALAEWLRTDGREAGADGLAVLTLYRQSFAQNLERVKPDLALSLSFDQDPIVVPAGQEFAAEWRLVEIAFKTLTRRIQQAASLLFCFAQIDCNPPVEAHVIGTDIHDVEVAEANPPDRGAQAAVRVVLCRVDPEDAGDVHARQRSIIVRQKVKQPLRAGGEGDALPMVGHAKTIQQRDADVPSCRWQQIGNADMKLLVDGNAPRHQPLPHGRQLTVADPYVSRRLVHDRGTVNTSWSPKRIHLNGSTQPRRDAPVTDA